MAEPLKHQLDANAIRAIASGLSRAHVAFPVAAFIDDALAGLEELALSARAAHIAKAMRTHLPASFPVAAAIIVAALGAEAAPTGSGSTSLRYWPHAAFVQSYGIDDLDAALAAQYEITKRFTAEFSIRPFLQKYPEASYARLREWSADPNVHVRRLVSEGTRPRLPWAARLPAYVRDPAPVLALLERLKDDHERYVQRSVANNLNDISKDHPDTVIALCRQWLVNPSPSRQWIVRHALRTLVKQGHRGALDLLGAGAIPTVTIHDVHLSPQPVALGDVLTFSFRITNSGSVAQALLVDYAVHYVKNRGSTRPKVFKLRRLTLVPQASAQLSATVSFQQLSTRRHYPGQHRIEVLINAEYYPLGEFTVVAGRVAGPPKR